MDGAFGLFGDLQGSVGLLEPPVENTDPGVGEQRPPDVGGGFVDERQDRRAMMAAKSNIRVGEVPIRISSRRLQRLDPVAQQVRTGVAGFLGVKLSRPQRPVLHRRDEGLAVLGPGHQRRC
jgi:hypothetical protein